MLITVDGNIDLAFRCGHMTSIALQHLRHRLDALVNGGNWLHCRSLLRLRLLLILDAGENGVTRTITVVSDALTAHLIGQPVEPLHFIHRMAIRSIHRFANTGVRVLLDSRLYPHMLLWRQVIGCDEVSGRLLVGMLIAPLRE